MAGVALDKVFRTTLGKPVPTVIFLALNGIVLFVTEQLTRGGTGRRRAGASLVAEEAQLSPGELSDQRITRMTMRHALAIGAAQVLALSPGVSRSGSTISAGIFKGLGHDPRHRRRPPQAASPARRPGGRGCVVRCSWAVWPRSWRPTSPHASSSGISRTGR
ncbi:undecaprenyl-diphosphate phosphatase [Streptomyces monashensis]|uniref:undecaprenyl-diphosphate phosphatase n=1 Tax=Streptomyces monashensis TaxID=1678012 RepID=UPI000A5C8857